MELIILFITSISQAFLCYFSLLMKPLNPNEWTYTKQNTKHSMTGRQGRPNFQDAFPTFRNYFIMD